MSETVTVSYKHYMELSALEGQVNLLKDALEKTDNLLSYIRHYPQTIKTEQEIEEQHMLNLNLLHGDDFD